MASPRGGSPRGAASPRGASSRRDSGDGSPGRGSTSPGRKSLQSPSKGGAASPGRGSPGRSPERLEDGDEGAASPRSPSGRRSGRGSRSKKEDQEKGGIIPKCRCCVTACPCFYCFHPEVMVKREELIRRMEAAMNVHHRKAKKVSMNLINDQIRMDRERRQEHNKKWRRRWIICCILYLVVLIAGSVTAILILATASWTLVNEECNWEARADFGLVYTGSTLYLTGGTDGSRHFGDVWASDDKGESWRMVVSAAAWEARHGHNLLYFGTTLYQLGGDTQTTADYPLPSPRADVWSSQDGREWIVVNRKTPWPRRKKFGAATDAEGVFYVLGGDSGIPGSSGLSDMWKSEDFGATWQAVTLASAWSARHSFGFVLMPGGTRPGRLYVMGGYSGQSLNDVWVSDDKGASWKLMTFAQQREMTRTEFVQYASWRPRHNQVAIGHTDGILTVTGGQLGEGAAEEDFSQEVWQLDSPVGDSVSMWERATGDDQINLAQHPLPWQEEATPPWSRRYSHGIFIDEENVVYIVGGRDYEGMKRDVWKKVSSTNLRNLQVYWEQSTATAMATNNFGAEQTEGEGEGEGEAASGSGSVAGGNATASFGNNTGGSNEDAYTVGTPAPS